MAALEATRTGNDPLLLVLPSDHVIRDETAFQTAVHVATEAAAQGKLVTFGIIPNTPEIGYGYIKATGNDTIRPVERFIEKPDLATAQSYLASGDYFWNSGMFLFRASRYLAELSTFQPAIAEACQRAWSAAKRDTDFIRLDKEAFESSPADSIDYAVMEHTADAVAVPLDAGWNDVGSWSALHEVSKQDNDGNAHQGDVIQIDCRNTYAYGSRLIAMVGLENVVVVETDDALLVAHRDSIQTVKEIVGKIKANGRPEATRHRKVYRPWGHTTPSTPANASKSSASPSSPAAHSAYKCTITVPNTGSWSTAPPKSHAAAKSYYSPKIRVPISPSASPTAYVTQGNCRSN